MIEDKDIRDMNQVREILDNLREYIIAFEEQIGELSEDMYENIGFQLAEIDGFIIGKQKCIQSNFAMGDIRMMYYWDYIEGKCNFNELLVFLKKYEGEV